MSKQASEEVPRLTLDVVQLAQCLGLPLATVRRFVSTDPEKLPPRVKTGGKRLVWSIDIVREWLRERSEVEQ